MNNDKRTKTFAAQGLLKKAESVPKPRPADHAPACKLPTIKECRETSPRNSQDEKKEDIFSLAPTKPLCAG
jgi:hypothetical protein